MRTDDSTARDSFRQSKEWTHNATTGETNLQTDQRMIAGDEVLDGKMIVHSLSGHERNHFFLNRESGREFTDLSALSGLDSIADGRGFSVLDYDRDGWQDVVVVNANAPLTQLFHNDIGRNPEAVGGMIAVRFVGGNATPSVSEFCNRDGYGATLEVALAGGVRLTREHRCGEGFATQNSATMIVGIGRHSEAASVTVRWPSGESSTLENVPEGTLVTVYENRPAGAFTQVPYRVESKAVAEKSTRLVFPVSGGGTARVRVYTTTATWCAACLSHLPSLAHLKEEGVAIYGVPIDPDDDAEKLAGYVEKRKPPYEMLAEMGPEEKQAVADFLAQALGTRSPVLPSSVITDSEGNVLEVMEGIPTLSQVRKWDMLR